jgi:hypothetical protein
MDGALGPVVFQGGLGTMSTFHAMSKVKKETYVKHRVIQYVDLLEDTGAEPIELSIQMHFHAPYTVGPGRALTQLEALMDAKIPVPLIVGSTPVGRGFLTLFVIEEISTKMSKFISSSLIVGDIDIKLCEYAGALGLGGPLSALGGALPGMSSAVSRITSAISASTGVLNIATSASQIFGLGSMQPLGGKVGGILQTLSGANLGNSVSSAMSNALAPGTVTQIRVPTQATLNTAITNLRAAGH